MSAKVGSKASVNTVIEPSRETPVRDEVDVLVVGGGLGGVSAAVAAARAGARTLLVERNGFPGGVATAGLCCSVHNRFYTPSHELIVKGNALEFVDALAEAGGPSSHWHDHKGHIIYDVERGKLVLIELLERAGVTKAAPAAAAPPVDAESCHQSSDSPPWLTLGQDSSLYANSFSSVSDKPSSPSVMKS